MLNSAENYNQKFRPQFHYSPMRNWMNDPNGLVYYEGEYHLFYQYNPESNVWGPMHWGHAVSSDLIHWEELPIALYPDEHGTIFSGSAVVDTHDTSKFFDGRSGIVAIFTHNEYCNQKQSIAYSRDNGRTWIKYEHNPIIHNPGIRDFRDPKVFWHEETGKWVMLVACGDRVSFFSSLDLKKWNYISEFGVDEGSHGGVWECPDIFKLSVDEDKENQKWVLKVDITDGAFAGGSGGQYFIGEFDGIRFTNDNLGGEPLWVDYGKDFYASQSWQNAPDQYSNVWIGWMSNWQYAQQTPTSPWRSAMTIPRKCGLRLIHGEGIRLVQSPVPSIFLLRKNEFAYNALKVGEGEKLTLYREDDLLEICSEFGRLDCSELKLSFKNGCSDELNIGYDFITKKVYLDRSAVGDSSFSDNFAARHEVELKDSDEKIRLHVLIDRSSVELFVNEGEVVITDLIFPIQALKTIELISLGGEAQVISFTVYGLESALTK